jgi:hypothetical protein
VWACMGLVSGMPPLMDASVTTLCAAKVAKVALVGLDPSVGPLVDANLLASSDDAREGWGGGGSGGKGWVRQTVT